MSKQYEQCYLVIKLGRLENVDFWVEHKKLLDKYGYVDFARVSKKRIQNNDFDKTKVYIKESKSAGDKLFEASMTRITKGEKYPKYYENIIMYDTEWFRITNLQIVDKRLFFEKYCKLDGKEIKAFDRGAVPFFFVKSKEVVN